MNAGYFEEACAWRDWLLRAAAGSPDQVQIMYGIRGERQLIEWEANWLRGYEDSRPVRIGNAAFSQLQLDVYGEVADALLHGYLGGIPVNDTALGLQEALTDHLVTIWEQADHGIWEVRGELQNFTYSKVMAWVAFDRTLKIAEKFGLRGDLARWREVRDQIHRYISDNCFDTQLGSFTQNPGSKELDASLLLMPLVGFLPVTDSRVQGTVAAIERQLIINGLVARYRTEIVETVFLRARAYFSRAAFGWSAFLR